MCGSADGYVESLDPLAGKEEARKQALRGREEPVRECAHGPNDTASALRAPRAAGEPPSPAARTFPAVPGSQPTATGREVANVCPCASSAATSTVARVDQQVAVLVEVDCVDVEVVVRRRSRRRHGAWLSLSGT